MAQHSCIVADLVPEEYKLSALLHDAPEAYLGDMTRPLKQWISVYEHFEDCIWWRICDRFGIAPELPACVHKAKPTAGT